MLKNAYFLAKIGADTAENEQQFAELLLIDRRVAARVEVLCRFMKEHDPEFKFTTIQVCLEHISLCDLALDVPDKSFTSQQLLRNVARGSAVCGRGN